MHVNKNNSESGEALEPQNTGAARLFILIMLTRIHFFRERVLSESSCSLEGSISQDILAFFCFNVPCEAVLMTYAWQWYCSMLEKKVTSIHDAAQGFRGIGLGQNQAQVA